MFSLSLEFWSHNFFNVVGNFWCSYVEAHRELGVYCVAHILVNLYLYEESAENIELTMRTKVHFQAIDYIGMPFKFNRCHKYGHIE